MRYPASSDVISIFDQSAQSILTRCQALVVFCHLVFLEFLRWSICQSKLSFEFIIKWRQAEAVCQEYSWRTDQICRRTRKYKNKEENCIWCRVIQEFHSDIKPWLAWFNISSWAFTTSSERPPFEIHLWRRKKDGFD